MSVNSSRVLVAVLGLLCASCGNANKTAPVDAGSPASSAVASSAVASSADASPASPSASLADVVATASPSWEDAGRPVVTAGEVDGALLRARHRARLAKDRSPVTVLAGGPPLELGQRICEASVPKRAPDTPILLKPNIGGFEWFKDPKASGGDDGLKNRITQPEFVRGVVRCLKARGHTRVTIAEGWGAKHADWQRLVRASGYEAMAREEGVPLVAMDDDGVFDVEGDRPGLPMKIKGMADSGVPTLLLPKILAEHLERGMFISVPKLKAHRFGVVSIALKGMQGTVMSSDAAPAFHQKWRTHRELSAALKSGSRSEYVRALELFAERMIDVLEVSAPDVVLVDGAPGVGGDGFSKQWPASDNVAVGGTNPVLVDRVGAQLLGLWDHDGLAKELSGHRTSPLVEAGAKRFGLDIQKPEVRGDGASLLEQRRPAHLVGMAGFEIHDGGGAGASTSSREARALRVEEGDVRVDGHAADPAWALAPALDWSTDHAGKPTGVRTSARFAWSPKALYVLFELDSAGLFVDRARPVAEERAKLYEEDCVELFVAPDPAHRGRYAEVEIGPFGHFFDLWIDREKKTSDVAWSSAPTIATRRDEAKRKVWIEARVAAPEIARALAPGAKLPLALYRMEGKSPRSYLAWSPPQRPGERPNFHVPDAFGALLLGEASR
ncbi:MAG: DUF362 domain-containing protein [Myxococcales bacterium]|nr:DUF362 domain-containing protein [Myxococcales bacterium]